MMKIVFLPIQLGCEINFVELELISKCYRTSYCLISSEFHLSLWNAKVVELSRKRIGETKFLELARRIQKLDWSTTKYDIQIYWGMNYTIDFLIHSVYFTCITSTCSNQTEAFVVQSSTFGYGRWRTIQIVYSICITSTCRSQTRLELSNAVFHRKHRAFDTQDDVHFSSF